MKNDYIIVFCERCGSQQQHFEHWECREYTICLGCSNAGRKGDCIVCLDMKHKLSIAMREIEDLLESEHVKKSKTHEQYARRLVTKEITIDDVGILLK